MRPASYGETVWVLNNLPFLLRDARRRRELTLRQAARQIGVAQSTLFRLETEKVGYIFVALKIIRWLDSGDDV